MNLLKLKPLLFISAIWLTVITTSPAQTVRPGSVLVLYDNGTNTANVKYSWIGNVEAKLLANLMGHFDLPCQIKPVEKYTAGDATIARATFYLGLTYDNPLPAAFLNDLMTTTNPVCWFKYNLWQLSWYNPAFNPKFGFGFNWLDTSGYSTIVYKGETFSKNQLDPELGYVSIFNTNLVSTPMTAWKTNADGTTANIPYAIHSSNFWYIADSPFSYIGEEDRYIAFGDLLHDILGINHATSHRALIRLEDCAPVLYTPQNLKQSADTLRQLNVPFSLALISVYTDPRGIYNNGVPQTHRLSDATDSVSKNFLDAVRYAIANGAQVILEGYTHQYSNLPNPYDGVTGDDFEFWNETFSTNNPANPYTIGLYQPVPEDSAAWAAARVAGAKLEIAQAGVSAVGFFAPHYAASVVDYQVFATNFQFTMERSLYFADDYDPTNSHYAGQFFPFQVNKDLYGRTVLAENIGGYEPTPWLNYPTRSPADIIRAAKKNLVVRDGWANAYFHGFYPLTNLQQIVAGIQALGYTYVQLNTNEAPTITAEPQSVTNVAGMTTTFTVAASGSQPLTYRWFLNGTPIRRTTTATLTLPYVQTANAGNYAVVVTNAFGTATSTVATLTVLVAPTITTQPQSTSVILGSNANFTVTATGDAPLTYQWQFNGTNLPGATSAALNLLNVQPNNAGGYSVAVSNPSGTTTSTSAILTLGYAPVITMQPRSRNSEVQTSVTFKVVASGTPSPSYQWRFNGMSIGDATMATYTIDNVRPRHAGSYSVVVRNSLGAVTSATVKLTVQ